MKNRKGYRELSQRDRDMVYVLAMGLCASDEKNPVAYTDEDISKKYGINRRSLGALKANIVRQG